MVDGQRLEFVPRLEALRGVAAVSIVAYHVFPQFIETNVTGMAPVVLFFVLSGFVLARSLARNDRILDFARHRVFRLFPAAITTVVLLTFLHATTGFVVGYASDFSAVNIVLNALMIRHDINGPMWSMTVECVATPLIYVAFIAARHRVALLWPVIVVLFGLSFIGQYVHLLGGYTNLAPLYCFVVGVWWHFTGRGIVEALGRSRNLVAAAACAAFCIAAVQKQTALTIIVETVGAGFLMAVIAFDNPAARPFRILDNAVVRFFGRISYSFYLLHMIGVGAAFRMPMVEGSPIVAGTLMTIVSIACTTPIAWASWRLIEVPFIALGRKFGERGLIARTPAPS